MKQRSGRRSSLSRETLAVRVVTHDDHQLVTEPKWRDISESLKIAIAAVPVGDTDRFDGIVAEVGRRGNLVPDR